MSQHIQCFTRVCCIALLAGAGPAPCAERAADILAAASLRGGLIVHLGCEDGALTAKLYAGEGFLVHGLDADPANVRRARQHIRSLGLYGPVTVSRLAGPRLPFVDGLVNLLLVSGGADGIAPAERLRVVAPGGAVVDATGPELKVTRKPRPETLDDWSHYLYDASNNAVSRDAAVDFPQGLRWTCGPTYARSHEHFASLSAMVAAGGRVFYIIDEGPISSVYLPPKWRLVCRDAFSGLRLWDRPIADWETHLRGFRSGPPEIGRMLVATARRVYAILGLGGPVSVLDAATGRPLGTVPGTDGAREMVLADGVLYVVADDMTPERHRRRGEWINSVWPTLSIWYRFPRKAIDMYGVPRIVAARPGQQRPLWVRRFAEPGEVMPTTLAVAGGRVCVQTVSHVVCLNAADGSRLWRAARPVARSRPSWSAPSLVLADGVVLTIDRTATSSADAPPPSRGSRWVISSGGREIRQDAELVAFSAATGRRLWRAPYQENYNVPQDIFVIRGVVWVGNLRRGVDGGFTEGRDLHSGKVVATIPPQKGWGHHRCYRNRATVRWILLGRGGTGFLDPADGTVRNAWWLRGGCQYGLMPANGLLYAPPHSCACGPETMLTGFNALSPTTETRDAPGALRKGPAFEAPCPPAGAGEAAEWPTYRRDAARSGFQPVPAPRPLRPAWTARLGAPVTAPVAAEGLVFVAETDRHALHAFSADSGRPAWSFLADGRIDSPPTVFRGRCVFGTRSGVVYCLRAADGALAWRFRAAPCDRRLVAYGRLESAWPVHGSVLVLEGGPAPAAGTVYLAAGRTSTLDGGIRLYGLDIQTGRVLHRASVAVGARGPGGIRRGATSDILSCQGGTIWMRRVGVDRRLAPAADAPHLFAPGGFLDGTWWHRTYWVYAEAVGGGYTNWPVVGNAAPAGRLLTHDGRGNFFGYGRMRYRVGDGHVRPDATGAYRLFAERLRPRRLPPRKGAAAPPAGRAEAQPGRREVVWSVPLPFIARGLVLTRDAVLAAGSAELPGAAVRPGPGTLWVVSRADGARLAQCALPAGPVLDGLALTSGGLFVSGTDGSLTCLR